MKKATQYSILFVLVALIFYGGAGINMMAYCCGDCRSEGVNAVLVDKCCEIHDHHHDAEEPTHHHQHECSADLCDSGDEDCCGLERIDFEWVDSHYPVEQPLPMLCELPDAFLPSFSLSILSEQTNPVTYEATGPPCIVCPRVYLSLLTTLLI